MSKFVFPPSISSRPTYGTLASRPAAAHLFVADAEGAEAMVDLARADAELFGRAEIIYLPEKTATQYIAQLEALNPAGLFVGSSYDASLPRLRKALSDAHMGLQVYLTGTEGLMGKALLEVTTAGIALSAVQTEHRGSVARRMQCVHCKGITEGVSTDPFVCAHCGLNLFVRDHYSRRMAAFQGVCVDAETPGNVPAQVEIYR